MDYHKLYKKLIDYRKNIMPTGYTENHHIIPKSLGGSDDDQNLVKLTGREHWIAHLLLHKIYKRKETAHACHMMAMKCEERGIPKVRNSRMYQSIRESLLPFWSANGKQRVGSKNGSYGTRWICNIEHQENKKISKEDSIPDGWIAGRSKWNAFNKIQKRKEQQQKENKEQQKIKDKEDKFWYDKYISSGLSLRKFTKLSDYPYSHVTLSLTVNKFKS